MNISGIHHVTAIAGDAQRNLDFYTGVLGLRLVKRTVNFDDPGTYHFYFGDEAGRPGTILTFFPWRDAVAGRSGAGMVTRTAFSVPESSTGYWIERLVSAGVDHGVDGGGGSAIISFSDHDGLPVALVATRESGAPNGVWSGGPVPGSHAIRSFHGVTIQVDDPEPSARLLTEVLGFQELPGAGSSVRLAAPGEEPARAVDIIAGDSAGRGGRGTVHHVAFRVASDAQQLAWRERLLDEGYHVTPVRDRQYFRSIYFREPGGVLFELATDTPGFAIDEPVEALGTALRLPEWLEPRRGAIEKVLPPISLRSDARSA